MAFNLNYLGRVSTSANTQALKVWTYNGTSTGTDEAVATIVASAYFNAAQQNLTSGSESGLLQLGDVIHVHGNDASGMYIVDSITTNVTVGSYAAIGEVDTANIADDAVTAAKLAPDAVVNDSVDADAAIEFSKLENLDSAKMLVGSSANVPTEREITGDVTISNTGVTAVGANKVLSSMLSPLLLKYAVVTISASEFNGMYAAPKLLVAAGGADTLITLHRAELLMTYVANDYAAGGVVAIQYDSTANGAGVIASTTQAAADFHDSVDTANAFEGGIVKQPFSTCVNKGLYLSNVTGAFTTGDSTFEMHVWYSVIPTV